MRNSRSITSLALAKKIARIASDHKALDIVVIDLRNLSSFTDFFVIASGMSDTHVKAIADSIYEEMKEKGRMPIGEEGAKNGHWALVDYGDVVAHIFHHTDRAHYHLEKLWYDAPRLSISESPRKKRRV